MRRCCCWSLEDLDFGGNFDVQLIGVDATVCLTCCLTSSGVFTFVTWKKSLGSSISLIVLLLISGARICFESRKVCGYVDMSCWCVKDTVSELEMHKRPKSSTWSSCFLPRWVPEVGGLVRCSFEDPPVCGSAKKVDWPIVLQGPPRSS